MALRSISVLNACCVKIRCVCDAKFYSFVRRVVKRKLHKTKACPSQEMVLPMSYDVIDVVTSRCDYRARTVRSSGSVRRARCPMTEAP